MKESKLENMMNSPNISIIVPVYNVEDYLVRCLDSIFNQDFLGKIEVIAVDDCSTDNSLSMLYDYKNKFPSLIIVEHKQNSRLAQARTSGMRIAKGDYIMHVDSDDWLLDNSLQKIYDKCIETNVDVLVFDYLIENEKGDQVFNNSIENECITSDKLAVQQHFYGRGWTKVVKRALTENMVYSRPEAPRSTEDLIYCTEVLLKAKSICIFPHKFYGYFINSNSITQSTSPINYLNNQIIVVEKLNAICNTYNPSAKFRNDLENYFAKYLFLSIAKTHFYKKELLQDCIEVLKEINKVPLLRESIIKTTNKAISNKYYSLLIVSKYFNFRLALGILLRSIKKQK